MFSISYEMRSIILITNAINFIIIIESVGRCCLASLFRFHSRQRISVQFKFSSASINCLLFICFSKQHLFYDARQYRLLTLTFSLLCLSYLRDLVIIFQFRCRSILYSRYSSHFMWADSARITSNLEETVCIIHLFRVSLVNEQRWFLDVRSVSFWYPFFLFSYFYAPYLKAFVNEIC